MSAFDPLPELKNWIPYKMVLNEDSLLFRWLCVGNKRYSEPFFEDSLRQCKSLPENSDIISCVTTLETLAALAAKSESIKPSAFIFHVSRCGSTLLSQLLSLQNENLVLSEVPLIEQVLRSDMRTLPASGISREELLKSVVRLLCQRRAFEKNCFVKLDCWHIFFYTFLRDAYPDVPFILQYRDPSEVIQSHLLRRGSQVVPGMIDPADAGLKIEDIAELSLDEYLVRMLEKLYSGLLKISINDPRSLLLNYSEGPENWLKKIQSAVPFGVSSMQAVEHRAAYHSKYPEQEFYTENLYPSSEGAHTFLDSLYEQLEELRKVT